MAYRLLVHKWRILKAPLQVPLAKTGTLFLAITRMHNYCINENKISNTLENVIHFNKGNEPL
jgi:hypothetical protein